jgi:3-oxoacyl-[acyl-carrier protein] reductase
MANLQGKVALVTGASKGIGAGIARELAGRGAAVAVNYSGSKAAADKLVADIRAAGGKAVALQADLSNPDSVGPFVEKVARELGPIDILVNNAGVYEFAPLEAVTEDSFHKQFNLNVLGLILTSQAAVKQFGPSGGNIINIGSVVSTITPANASVYSASKGAVDAVTKSLAKELGPRKIRVNSINPGMVITEGLQTAGFEGSDFQKDFESKAPLGRVGQPDDIAPAAVFLASNDSAWLTGETLVIAGGTH